MGLSAIPVLNLYGNDKLLKCLVFHSFRSRSSRRIYRYTGARLRPSDPYRTVVVINGGGARKAFCLHQIIGPAFFLTEEIITTWSARVFFNIKTRLLRPSYLYIHLSASRWCEGLRSPWHRLKNWPMVSWVYFFLDKGKLGIYRSPSRLSCSPLMSPLFSLVYSIINSRAWPDIHIFLSTSVLWTDGRRTYGDGGCWFIIQLPCIHPYVVA